VLRCEELELISRCVARMDAGLPHPGVPLLLLCQFAPITDSEDGERALSLRSSAWRSLKLFNDEEIGQFLKIGDFRGTGVEWQCDGQGNWTLHLNEDQHPEAGLYSLRRQENDSFPFEHLADAMAEAARIVAA